MQTFQEYMAAQRVCGDTTFDLWIADDIGKLWYGSSSDQTTYERLWCRQHVKEGDLAVDCGAHQGIMTVLFSYWVGAKGHVIAFEPTRVNADIISKNVRLNRRTNVEIHAQAVGSKHEWTTFGESAGTAVLGKAATSFAPSAEKIEVVPLDRVLKGRKPDFMKIDVEGFELEVLKGAQQALVSLPKLDLEIHSFMHPDRLMFLTTLLALLPDSYRYEVQPTPADVPLAIGTRLDIPWLANFDNPHLFGVPA